MASSSARIEAASEKLEADDKIPLKNYYGLAEDLLKQAGTLRKEKKFEDLYILLLRFSSLILETIPSHKEYKWKHQKKRDTLWKKAIDAISEIDSLRPYIECQNRESNNMHDFVGSEKNSWDNHKKGGSGCHFPEKQESDFDKDVTNSKIDSNSDACLHGEGTSAQSIDDHQSFKQEDAKSESGIFYQLKHSIANIALLKQEIYEESCKRKNAEQQAFDAEYNAQISEELYVKEMNQRVKMEEALIELVLKLEEVKNNRDEIFQELKKIQEKNESFGTKISAVEDEMPMSLSTANATEVENGTALGTIELALSKVRTNSNTSSDMLLHFSYSELEEATRNFDISMRIGEGRYGSVYKGVLRYSTFAIKTVNPQYRRGHAEFLREVGVRSRVRHPNLVNMIGVCSESESIIYEFLPNGSLEDHLNGNGYFSLISWQNRIAIATDISTTLAFLHSCKPYSVVHGNLLKPSNILFDGNFASKICWSSISPDIDSNDSSAYTIECDIYSFGVVLLRLLTGRSAVGVIEEVVKALHEENLHNILDKSAGEWSFVQAKQLAHLGLRCCDLNPENRPNFGTDVLRVLEPMRKASTVSVSLFHGDDPPSYFLCPILQEIMTDPQFAADGHTYEAEAVKGWFDSGHDTSPMTNVKITNKTLTPNYALRSAIQEWMHKRGKLE